MHHANSQPLATALRLFPRLANPQRSQRTTRADRPHRGRTRRVATMETAGDNPRAQVRARLLRMILDSEEARRNGPRPTAG